MITTGARGVAARGKRARYCACVRAAVTSAFRHRQSRRSMSTPKAASRRVAEESGIGGGGGSNGDASGAGQSQVGSHSFIISGKGDSGVLGLISTDSDSDHVSVADSEVSLRLKVAWGVADLGRIKLR